MPTVGSGIRSARARSAVSSARFSDSCMIRSVSLSARTRSRHCTSSISSSTGSLKDRGSITRDGKRERRRRIALASCACTASNCRRASAASACAALRSRSDASPALRRPATADALDSAKPSCSLASSLAWIAASQSTHKSANARAASCRACANSARAIRSVASPRPRSSSAFPPFGSVA